MDECIFFPLTVKEAAEAKIKFTSKLNQNAIFPTRLRELRKAALPAITQSDLAEYVGATRATIGLYENGDSVPDIKRFVKLAQFYHVSYDYLLREDGAMHEENVSIHDQIGLSDRSVNLLRMFYRSLHEGGTENRAALAGMFHLIEVLLCETIEEIALCNAQIRNSAEAMIIGCKNDDESVDPLLEAAEYCADNMCIMGNYRRLVVEPDDLVKLRAQELAEKVKKIVLDEYYQLLQQDRDTQEGEDEECPMQPK